MASPLGTAALSYAQQGLAVFPCVPGEKRPATEHGFKDATTDEAQVRAWWEAWPDANIAMPTGEITGYTVIDLDGPQGVAFVRSKGLPRTWTVRTPRGGLHLYYAYCPELHTGAAFVPEVDVRSDGGYVLVLPSVVGGKVYTVVVEDPVAELTPIPPELRQKNRSGAAPAAQRQPEEPKPPHWVSEALYGVPESQRNDMAARLVGYFHGKGLADEVILAIMEPWAERCSPPMNRHELAATLRSVVRYPVGVGPIRSHGNERTLFG